jgi:hypothetical protein
MYSWKNRWNRLSMQKKFLLVAILLIGCVMLGKGFSKSYSNDDIIYLQKTMGISREDAIRILDDFEKASDKSNNR